ncbi:winged helix-turn-helix transcriptional regulator [Jejubacter calystegiae]|uniref:Winged helix-turn-helix transcriptional regulator n=1 Tax=Jejubacter calystegiae TaxID=2579935 RepID=A0A4P8YKU8_9ENTR|nr:MarR family winged helix-turn-helix transcriptional regulator [Jejubacter calystegiae]QCT20428.1 winged helix-turn-helix transcriptional regulator [Jejubacter calystegiae]
MSTMQDKSQREDDGYDFTRQVGHLLRRVHQRYVAIFQNHISDPQLTAVQFTTLCALRDRGPSAQRDLVDYTAVDQATIRGIVARLKARGLVELGPDPEDGRKVIVMLTSAGAELLDQVIPAARGITELAYGELNPAERVALDYLLRKMLAS